jgi:hypothetical protein
VGCPTDLDEPDEFDPHAAIAVQATMTATVRAVAGARRGGRVTRARSFIMPSSGLGRRLTLDVHRDHDTS